VLKLLHQWLDLAGPQAQLLQQPCRAPPAPPQAVHALAAGGHRGPRGADRLPVPLVGLDDPVEGPQVEGHPFGDGFLGEVFGRRDLHRAVEGQIALEDLGEDVGGLLEAVVALQDAPAEVHPRHLDLLGQVDLLLARQQGDLAHLGQVHPDGIVDPLGDGFELFLGGLLVLVLFLLAVGERLPAIDLGLVQQFDAQLVERHQERIEPVRRDGLIGQVVVHLLVRQVATFFALGDESLDTGFQGVGHSMAPARPGGLGRRVQFR